MLLGFAALGVGGAPVDAQEDSLATNFIKCRSYFDTRRVELDGELEITQIIECIKQGRSVFLPVSVGLWLTVFRDGRYVEPRILEEPFRAPSLFRDPKRFLDLELGMTVGSVRRVKVREFFPAAGTYTGVVYYRSPVLRSIAIAKNVICVEDGDVVAPELNIIVS